MTPVERALDRKRRGILLDCSARPGRDMLLSMQLRDIRTAFIAAGCNDHWRMFWRMLKVMDSYSVRVDKRWIVKNRQVQPNAARARKRPRNDSMGICTSDAPACSARLPRRATTSAAFTRRPARTSRAVDAGTKVSIAGTNLLQRALSAVDSRVRSSLAAQVASCLTTSTKRTISSTAKASGPSRKRTSGRSRPR